MLLLPGLWWQYVQQGKRDADVCLVTTAYFRMVCVDSSVCKTGYHQRWGTVDAEIEVPTLLRTQR